MTILKIISFKKLKDVLSIILLVVTVGEGYHSLVLLVEEQEQLGQ